MKSGFVVIKGSCGWRWKATVGEQNGQGSQIATRLLAFEQAMAWVRSHREVATEGNLEALEA